jgi:hypothetical protein
VKKIISILSAIAMIATVMASVAFAETEYYFTLEKDATISTDTVYAYWVRLNVPAKVYGFGVKFDTSDLEAKGATIAVGNYYDDDEEDYVQYGNAPIVNYNSEKHTFTVSGSDTKGYTAKKCQELAVLMIDISKATGSFTLPAAAGFTTEILDGTSSNLATAESTAGFYGFEVEVQGTTPPEPDKFEAKVNGSEITFENAALSENNKEIGGKAIKIFGKEFTVKADSTSKFVITAKGTTKTFGKTAAEYLGIEGKGDATGNVTVGIIYDKEQYSADDFSIAQE